MTCILLSLLSVASSCALPVTSSCASSFWGQVALLCLFVDYFAVPRNGEEILRQHQRKINKKMTTLVEIVDGLHGERVISDADKDEIMGKATSYEKNSALMTCLMKKAQKGFPVFVQLLKETDQDELAKLLTQGEYKEMYHDVRLYHSCLIVRNHWHGFLPYHLCRNTNYPLLDIM